MTTISRLRLVGATGVMALLAAGLPIGLASAAAADHCPGGNASTAPPVDGSVYESSFKDEQGAATNDTVLPAGTHFCIKSGGQADQATGILVADGTTTLRQYLFRAGIIDGSGTQGRNVSYYMVYVPRYVPLEVSKTAAGTYTRTVTWDIDKNVDVAGHTLQTGQSGTSTYTVHVTKSEAESDYGVTGTISVTNPNAYPVSFSVADELDDGTVAAVDCGAGSAAGTAPASGAASCTYTAAPAGRSATRNTATVSVANRADRTAEAAVGWTENLAGYDQVTVDDSVAGVLGTVGGSHSWTYPRSFTCGQDAGTHPNTATIAQTGQSSSASVSVTCLEEKWKGESATPRGPAWPGGNWFMYTPYTAGPVDLLAGQHHDAGDITMTRNGTTSITITLHDGYRFAAGSNNVKVQAMSSAPTKFLPPGQYSVKKTATGSSITITGLSSTALYGIHVEVERRL